MTHLIDPLLIAALTLNFFALGTSRVRAVIHGVALQGALIGLLPLLVHQDGFEPRSLPLVALTVAIKGFVIPWLLVYAMREAHIRHEIEPLMGFVPSLIVNAIGTGLAMVFSDSLPLVETHTKTLLVPAALATALTGFLIFTTRKMAINQVLGYLVLENGIFMFGMLLVEAMPFLVELGVLLDLFTGVFIMGIIIHHISREASSLTELKE